MKTIPIILLVLIIFDPARCQTRGDLLEQLEKLYKAFEYEQVIDLSSRIIADSDSLPEKVLVEIYRMQGASYFSIDKPGNAKISFLKILDIDADFELSSRDNSPKIIAFFNDIKLEYISRNIITENDAEKQAEIGLLQDRFSKYKSGMLRSIAWPGWGHYQIDEDVKARLLNIAGFATLAPGIYYVFRTAGLEKDYLNETDRSKISKRYNAYNDAYHYRNYFLSAFAVVWLYSQYDYFFRDISQGQPTVLINPQINPSAKRFGLHLSFNF